MSKILAEIADQTGSDRPTAPDHVLRHYIEHPDKIECSVATDDNGEVLGFQSLKLASAGNPYNIAVGWGIIGTHVSPRAARRGVGSALFSASRAAAMAAGLAFVDATIGKANSVAQTYYEAMGFETYRMTQTSICKVLRIR